MLNRQTERVCVSSQFGLVSVPMRMHRTYTKSAPVSSVPLLPLPVPTQPHCSAPSCCTTVNNVIVCSALLPTNCNNGYNRSGSSGYLSLNLPFVPLVWFSHQRLYPNLSLSVLYVPLFDIHTYQQLCHYWSSISNTLHSSHYNQLMYSPSTSEPSSPPMDSHRY